MLIRELIVVALLALIGFGAKGQAIQVWLMVDTIYVDEFVGDFNTVEQGSAVYQMYVEMTHRDDVISTIYGDTINPMVL
ncbi:MAG: hypothetical protein ACI84C_002329 [Flavobacteriales bacterium]|jgi:hypothetical protein